MNVGYEPITMFRCETCNSPFHGIDETCQYDDVTVLSIHSDCKNIRFFTEEKYKQIRFKDVTPKCHTYHSEQWFLKKAGIICRIRGEFSRYDFPELRGNTFTKRVSRLRKKRKVFKTMGGISPTFRLAGEKWFRERGDVTLEGMGVGLEFEKILQDVCIQYPQIHKIKIQFDNEDLYKIFERKGREPDKRNKRINLGTYTLNEHVRSKVSVYPNVVQVDLSCTNEPIVFDTRGALELISILQKQRGYLLFQTEYEAQESLPECYDWIVKQYHFNKDSQKTYSGEKFEVTVSEMSSGFIRFYSKTFPDGVTRVRLEQCRSPNTAVKDEAVKMIRTDNYVHDRLGSKISQAEAFEILDIHHKKKPAGGFQTTIFDYMSH